MTTDYKILSLDDLAIYWEFCFLEVRSVAGILWLKVTGSHLVDCVSKLMVA